MPTTIEFDPDVAAALTRRRVSLPGTLREDGNRLVGLGLADERDEDGDPSLPVCTPTFDTGRPLVPIDDMEAAIARIEGADRH